MAQYLTYEEYKALYNGTLDEAVFSILERNAEYYINSQAGGQTGKRIDMLDEIPLSIKDCVYKLIEYLFSCKISASNSSHILMSESQSSDGVSESYSYKTFTQADMVSDISNIINTFLIGTGLLYKGIDCNCYD